MRLTHVQALRYYAPSKTVSLIWDETFLSSDPLHASYVERNIGLIIYLVQYQGNICIFNLLPPLCIGQELSKEALKFVTLNGY